MTWFVRSVGMLGLVVAFMLDVESAAIGLGFSLLAIVLGYVVRHWLRQRRALEYHHAYRDAQRLAADAQATKQAMARANLGALLIDYVGLKARRREESDND